MAATECTTTFYIRDLERTTKQLQSQYHATIYWQHKRAEMAVVPVTYVGSLGRQA